MLNKTRSAWLPLLVALGIGCGGGTDGNPVAPAPAPPPASEPAPDPPAKPSGIRVSDQGQDFVEWTWDAVEAATGYEGHAFRSGTPADQRPPLEAIEAPTFRADGLEPGAEYRFFVRAVRETAGGRAVSEWSDIGSARTLSPPPAACSNERQLALDWEHDAILVPAWDPERPFRIWIDEAAIRRGGNQLGRPEFLEEEVLEPLRDVAARIEERLGYPIFDPYDLLSSRPSRREPAIKILRRTGRERDRPWSAACLPATTSPMNALPWSMEIFFNGYFFDPSITCPGFAEDRTDETVIHELGHLFGMKHARSTGDSNSRLRGGVFMSEPLTSHKRYDDSDFFLLEEDIDAIGCIFPHPGHPR